jgi:homocysteine S-methyltransferase
MRPVAVAVPRESLAEAGDDGTGAPPPPTRLAAALAERRFVVSVEIDPPRSVRIERTIEAARLLRDAGADVVNISDSAMARVRMGALAVAFGIQHELDLECVVHFTTRDRNLMALESELLGAHALGVRDILALTGDPPRVADYPTATGSLGRRLMASSDLTRPERRRGPGRLTDQAPGRVHDRLRARPTLADAAPSGTASKRKLAAGAHLVMTQPL